MFTIMKKCVHNRQYKQLQNNSVVYCGYLKSSNYDIGIDTNIEVIVVSLTTWEAHHSPREKPEGCGELPRSLMKQQ